MSIDTSFLRRCIATLELALDHLQRAEEDAIIYDLHRAACVKEFELVLEQSGKLLRKRLAPYFASNRQADRLVFKDLFRHAAKHGLIDSDAGRTVASLPRQPQPDRARLRLGLRRSHPEAPARLPNRRERAGRHDPERR